MNNSKKITTVRLSIVALAAAINIVGGFIALMLHLPIYLDSIGTILVAVLFGPIYGLLPGLISGLISGFTSDIYSLYYIPVQLITGVMTGLIVHGANGMRVKGWKLFPAALGISIPGTIVSSAITAIVFGGITSSGSTILVQLLHHAGLGLTASVCVVQALTDYADRIIALLIVAVLVKALPKSLLEK